MNCNNIIGNGGADINGIQGGKSFALVSGDFTLISGKYYADLVHGYNDVIMEAQIDLGLGGGLELSAPIVDDTVAGTRTIGFSLLPASGLIKIIGIA